MAQLSDQRLTPLAHFNLRSKFMLRPTDSLTVSGLPKDYSAQILVAFLAGGRSRRMGQPDKFFLPITGKPMLQHVIERVGPQFGQQVIVANGDPKRFKSYQLPVLTDVPEAPPYAGPLAGIISAMAWGQKASPDIKWIASVPTDSPNLPTNLISQLWQATQAGPVDVVVPYCGARHHYACALWAIGSCSHLLAQLRSGERALHRVIGTLRHQTVSFPDPAAFANVNTPEDWQRLQDLSP